MDGNRNTHQADVRRIVHRDALVVDEILDACPVPCWQIHDARVVHVPRIPVGRDEDVQFPVVVLQVHVDHHRVALRHLGDAQRYHGRDETHRIPDVRLPRRVDFVHVHHEKPAPIADPERLRMIEVACGARHVPLIPDDQLVHRPDQSLHPVHVDSILSNFGVLPGFHDDLVAFHPFHDFLQPGPQMRAQPRKQVRTPV